MAKEIYNASNSKAISKREGIELVYNYNNQQGDNNKLIGYINTEPGFINSYAEEGSSNPIGAELLLYAYQQEDVNLISFLLEKGFDVNFKDNLNEPIINKIIKESEYTESKTVHEVLQLFTEKNANLNITNADNETPIFMAVKKKILPAVEFLLDQENVDINICASHKISGKILPKSVVGIVRKGTEIYDLFAKKGLISDKPISLIKQDTNSKHFELIFENVGNNYPTLQQNITVIQDLFTKSPEIQNLIKSATNKAGSNLTVKFDEKADWLAQWESYTKSIIIMKSELPIYIVLRSILFELCNADNDRLNNLINIKDNSDIYKNPYKYSLFMEKYEFDTLIKLDSILHKFLTSEEKAYDIVSTLFDNKQTKYYEALESLNEPKSFNSEFYQKQINYKHTTKYVQQWKKDFIHKFSKEEYESAINNHSFEETIMIGYESGLFDNNEI